MSRAKPVDWGYICKQGLAKPEPTGATLELTSLFSSLSSYEDNDDGSFNLTATARAASPAKCLAFPGAKKGKEKHSGMTNMKGIYFMGKRWDFVPSQTW